MQAPHTGNLAPGSIAGPFNHGSALAAALVWAGTEAGRGFLTLDQRLAAPPDTGRPSRILIGPVTTSMDR